MSFFNESDRRRARHELAKKIAIKEKQKQKARGQQHHTVWFGLGMFGLVGWSVTLPSLIGIVIGLWIDTRWPSRFSWTLMFLVSGVVMGCLNAWRWIRQESQQPDDE